ncbi:MAG TPA: hypothetical protein V6C72_03645, partial [Chroococcales cyanobacterium]
MAMLALLVTGVYQQWSVWRLLLSALIFSLGNLTRPLMAPFIAFEALILALAGWRKRGGSRRLPQALAAGVLGAFVLPAVSWMAVQKLVVGEASISQNDASAFYAASDPKIQVWNSGVYDAIEAAVRRETGRQLVTLAEANGQFWRQTAKNYAENIPYHISRMLPHVWTVANFTSKKSPRARYALEYIDLRIFMALIILAALLARDRPNLTPRRLGIAGLLLLAALSFPESIGIFTLGGALLPLFRAWRSRAELPFLFLSAFWFTGVAALYLVGGVSFDYQHMHTSWNGLGYRLIDQFYFVAVILQYYFLDRIIDVRLPHPAQMRLPVIRIAAVERPICAFLCWSPLLACLVALIAAESVGAAIVAVRCNERLHAVAQPYPSIAPIFKAIENGEIKGDSNLKLARDIFVHGNYRLSAGDKQPSVVSAFVGPAPARCADHFVDSKDYLVTGAGTEFIWNLKGQQRTTLAIYEQRSVVPFRMHPDRIIVDVPEVAERNYWQWRQGLFVIRAIPTSLTKTDLPYYVDRVVVRAFIPLTADKMGYDLDQAKWFPIAKYATDLLAGDELHVVRGSVIGYDESPGLIPFQRHFLLAGDAQGTAEIRVNASHARGDVKFSYGANLNLTPDQGRSGVEPVVMELNGGPQKVNARLSGPQLFKFQVALQADEDRNTPPRTIDLRFENLPHGGVWLYELMLQADDFVYRGPDS